jgi:hypothetical protein
MFKLLEHAVFAIFFATFTLQSVEEQTGTTRQMKRICNVDKRRCTTMELSGGEWDSGFCRVVCGCNRDFTSWGHSMKRGCSCRILKLPQSPSYVGSFTKSSNSHVGLCTDIELTNWGHIFPLYLCHVFSEICQVVWCDSNLVSDFKGGT